jgi:hypothetical protein
MYLSGTGEKGGAGGGAGGLAVLMGGAGARQGYAGYVRHMVALAHGKSLGARALCPVVAVKRHL